MIRAGQLRRWIIPTAPIGAAIAAAVVGVVFFVVGMILSFRSVGASVSDRFILGWNDFISRLFGTDSITSANHFAGGMLLLLGIALTSWGAKSAVRVLFRTVNPEESERMSQVYFKKLQLGMGPKIVALGGGTGLSTLLRGLKNHTSSITAIVTVTDDGGSSGRLTQELGIIPPGDLRACLVALADSEKQVTDLFQYRFKGQSGSLSGHSLGNLLIAGLVDICEGDFERALSMASEVLAIRGRVVPSTLEHVRLKALLDDGSEVWGETNIAAAGGRIRRIYLEPGDAHPYPAALQAIRDADIIVIGPGSVYTSVIPNLLVPGVPEAIEESKAKKVYVCNVMTQPGESEGFTACEHVIAINANVSGKLFDTVVMNNQLPSHDMLEKYRESHQFPVEADADRIRSMGYKVLAGSLMSESDYVRHDPVKVADAILGMGRKR